MSVRLSACPPVHLSAYESCLCVCVPLSLCLPLDAGQEEAGDDGRTIAAGGPEERGAADSGGERASALRRASNWKLAATAGCGSDKQRPVGTQLLGGGSGQQRLAASWQATAGQQRLRWQLQERQ